LPSETQEPEIREKAARKERAPAGLISEIRVIDVDATLRIVASSPPSSPSISNHKIAQLQPGLLGHVVPFFASTTLFSYLLKREDQSQIKKRDPRE
jgi:hypothetical protein